MGEPRILSDDEIAEIIATSGCSFGEGERPYFIADLAYTAKTMRQALKALSLSGSQDFPLWSWCDEGWTCSHPECRQGRYALTGDGGW